MAGVAGPAHGRRQVSPPSAAQGLHLDFVCFEARLIIEVDGGQHGESTGMPRGMRCFAPRGFRVLRFWNDEVTKSLNAVCLAIRAELRNSGE